VVQSKCLHIVTNASWYVGNKQVFKEHHHVTVIGQDRKSVSVSTFCILVTRFLHHSLACILCAGMAKETKGC
jgi:hypothetical protein